MPTVLHARSRGFVNTPAIDRLARRSLRYLQSGFAIHLRGPAGTGKTTLALHLADLLARPLVLIFGDDELKSSDLVGSQTGYKRKQVVDNYIHSVIKLEDELQQSWVDSRLTLAAKEGFTLVYDEFNRSRPEVNNILLSVLEEKLIALPPTQNRSEYLRVHPQFRAIFTSNPAEYCGVHATQDALMDRLITLDMPEPDQLTQIEILVQRTGTSIEAAEKITALVQNFRANAKADLASGLRPSIAIAKICQDHQIPALARNDEFREVCADVLLSRTSITLVESTQILFEQLNQLAENEPADVPETPPLLAEEPAVEPPAPPSLSQRIYEYVQHNQGAKLSEIEASLSLNRVETVNALRSLIQKGIIKLNDDRIYVQEAQLS
ncbi:MAG: gas vesicle protein GvpN [Desertifilum sp.]|nr:gas vesicle protein GvpN [Desertifilum sp.]